MPALRLRYTYHAMLKYQHVPGPETVAGLWKSRAGDAKVEAYNCGGGAACYIAKMFPYEDTRHDVGGRKHFARSQESDRTSVQRETETAAWDPGDLLRMPPSDRDTLFKKEWV